MNTQIQAKKSKVFYSWIPNLTGSLNFEYISDNIVQDDEEYKLYQFTESSDLKYFLFRDINFSDGIEKSEKGLVRNIICTLKREETKLTGEYYEFIPRKIDSAQKTSTLNQIYDNFENSGLSQYNLVNLEPNINAAFEIEFNGKIKITFDRINFILDGNNNSLNNIPLITYRAIKYVLHKDIFHSEEDDNIVGVYPTDDNMKEKILNNMLKYIKSYERLLKDNIIIYQELNWIRQDFYNRLINKIDGISSYMNSFNNIYELDSDDKYKHKITLSKNVIYSMKCMMRDLENDFLPITWKKEILSYATVLLVSTSILLTGLLDTNMKKLDSYLYYIFPIIITVIFSAVVFRRYTISRIAFLSYISDAHKSPEGFIKKRLTNYSDKPNKIGKYSLWFGITLISIGVLKLIFSDTSLGIPSIVDSIISMAYSLPSLHISLYSSTRFTPSLPLL